MLQTLGLIKNINVKGPAKGSWGEYYIHEFTVDSKVYVKFDKNSDLGFKVNDMVTIFYEETKTERGTQFKIIKIHHAGSPTPPGQSQEVVSQSDNSRAPAQEGTNKGNITKAKSTYVPKGEDPEKQQRIARCHAITTALTAIQISDTKIGTTPKSVIEFAKQLADEVLHYTTGVPF